MRLYMTILLGDQPSSAVPVVATEDPEIIHAAAEALASKLGVLTPLRLRELLRERSEGDAAATNPDAP